MRTTVVALCVMFAARAAAVEAPARTKADLDGDGTAESIGVEVNAKGVVCIVGARSVALPLTLSDEDTLSLTVVDINRAATGQDVLVSRTGQTDDDHTHVFVSMIKGEPVVLGALNGSFSKDDVLGNNILLQKRWAGFFARVEKSEVRGNKLVPVRQPLFWIGVEAKVLKSVPLLFSPDGNGKEVVANTAVGTKAMVVAERPAAAGQQHAWYLIKTQSGILGWISANELQALELLWAG